MFPHLASITSVPKHLKHRAHWLLLHVALIFFFCDLIGAIYPPFRRWWEQSSHLGVAVAAFCATVAEYIAE